MKQDAERKLALVLNVIKDEGQPNFNE